MNASAVTLRASFEDDFDLVAVNVQAAHPATSQGREADEPAADRPVSPDGVPVRVERSDRRRQKAEELPPGDAHLQVPVEGHSAAGNGGPDGEHLAFRHRSRRAIRPGHPVAINEHDGAQRLRNAVAANHLQNRRPGIDIEIDSVAGASLGREVNSQGGEQLEPDSHAVPAAARYAGMISAGLSLSRCFQTPRRRRPSMSPRSAPTWSEKPTQLAPTRRSPSNCRLR